MKKTSSCLWGIIRKVLLNLYFIDIFLVLYISVWYPFYNYIILFTAQSSSCVKLKRNTVSMHVINVYVIFII
ncbi:unnamed protein product [Acanthoscelides obtectus]|uniref:Uncharacterized protein n=1 Tax=Acanthoscelides obtectus TaxID=200917 RepID=A0A9P0PBI8_ACAOB|nr:unnamed protein product [Acanthoscelides obtectus]CAK1662839.1 hypothetical protein AOBTE_LOCUS23346 [Acanthoscelides obtectus]